MRGCADKITRTNVSKYDRCKWGELCVTVSPFIEVSFSRQIRSLRISRRIGKKNAW